MQFENKKADNPKRYPQSNHQSFYAFPVMVKKAQKNPSDNHTWLKKSNSVMSARIPVQLLN